MTRNACLSLDRILSGSGGAVGSTAGEALERPALAQAAHEVAGALSRSEIRPHEPVLVTIRNGPMDLAALFGVWLAGGVAVPVHGAAPRTTLQALREATGARLLLDGCDVEAIATHPPPARPLLEGAALIVFTSGSTGKPKGVVIGHDGFSAKLDVLEALLRFHPNDIVVVPLQLTFIFGLWTSLLTLRSGARLVLVPRFSPEVVGRALGEGGTILAAVPSMLRALLAAPGGPGPAPQTILTGGEALGTSLAGALREAFPTVAIHDLYGLTETGSCDFRLGPSDQPAGLGSIGSPTEGVDFRIVGEAGTAVPAGEAGELQIRTPFGMSGYLDDPDLTRASFADGYFRTGDIARVRPDGRVELVGRSKEIISRGGNKIAPLEIDNLLASHPEVMAALCTGVPDERLGEAIHAIVALKPGSSLTGEALRKWAGLHIERYKVPDAIHVRDAIPVGSTGKASRSAVADLVLGESMRASPKAPAQPRFTTKE